MVVTVSVPCMSPFESIPSGRACKVKRRKVPFSGWSSASVTSSWVAFFSSVCKRIVKNTVKLWLWPQCSTQNQVLYECGDPKQYTVKWAIPGKYMVYLLPFMLFGYEMRNTGWAMSHMQQHDQDSWSVTFSPLKLVLIVLYVRVKSSPAKRRGDIFAKWPRESFFL